MAENSKIEWTHHTFNPWRGCTKVSAGCKFCYAETLSERNPAILGVWGPNGSRPIAAESYWKLPLKWNREAEKEGVRKRVFCASLADVFEGPETMPEDDWEPVTRARLILFDLIRKTPNLDWLLLTKRPENVGKSIHLAKNMSEKWIDETTRWWLNDWRLGVAPDNVWIGTSVEDQKTADLRIPHLLKIPAKVRFLSCEPLLGRVNLERIEMFGDFLYHASNPVVMNAFNTMTYSERTCISPHEPKGTDDGIHWVIAGGESGRDARPMHPNWARSLRDQCQAAGVPFFFKQWGEWRTWRDEIIGESEISDPMDHRLRPGDELSRANYSDLREGSGPFRILNREKVGKKRAGRLLDDREWNEFPGGQS